MDNVVEGGAVNLCRTCNEDFGSVSAFDRHRVGTHEYTYSEGAKMDPPKDDGRRCLSLSELEYGVDRHGSEVFVLLPKGSWSIAADVERVKRAFA